MGWNLQCLWQLLYLPDFFFQNTHYLSMLRLVHNNNVWKLQDQTHNYSLELVFISKYLPVFNIFKWKCVSNRDTKRFWRKISLMSLSVFIQNLPNNIKAMTFHWVTRSKIIGPSDEHIDDTKEKWSTVLSFTSIAKVSFFTKKRYLSWQIFPFYIRYSGKMYELSLHVKYSFKIISSILNSWRDMSFP